MIVFDMELRGETYCVNIEINGAFTNCITAYNKNGDILEDNDLLAEEDDEIMAMCHKLYPETARNWSDEL